MSNKYDDPKNTKCVLEKLRTISTLKDVKKYIDEIFPTWIITFIDLYSPDYPHLEDNWYKVCDELGVEPAQIMVVDDVDYNDSQTLVKTFAELFTRAGFSVKRKCEVIPCKMCNCAIPTQILYNMYKESGHKVPEIWNLKCVDC